MTQTIFLPVDEITARPPVRRGIARLAEQALEIDRRNQVEYRSLPCRTLVSKVDTPRMPFQYAINPYRGCEFGCVYCYARYTHEFMELRHWEDFERKVFIKENAAEALRRDLRRLPLRGQWIAIGTATDPYQPAERRMRVTRSLLEVFAGRAGYRISITTKSDLVLRDLDFLTAIADRNKVHINVTITTPHHRQARVIEPRAARPDRRFRAVRLLGEAGVEASVFMMPLLPRINDSHADMELMCRLAAEAKAASLCGSMLFLRQSARQRFMPWLGENFPELVPFYTHLYGGRGGGLSAYSREKMDELGL